MSTPNLMFSLYLMFPPRPMFAPCLMFCPFCVSLLTYISPLPYVSPLSSIPLAPYFPFTLHPCRNFHLTPWLTLSPCVLPFILFHCLYFVHAPCFPLVPFFLSPHTVFYPLALFSSHLVLSPGSVLPLAMLFSHSELKNVMEGPTDGPTDTERCRVACPCP